MWRVIFMTGCDAILVDENRKTYQVRLEYPEHYEEIVWEAFEKGQEITFANYINKEEKSCPSTQSN